MGCPKFHGESVANLARQNPKARTALSQRCLAAGSLPVVHRSRSVVTGCYGAKGGRPVWISASSARAAGPKNGGDEMISGPDARS